MAYRHEQLARGRWFSLTLSEQLGNIGSEVGRARKWQGGDERLFEGAADRALELFDLTLQDPRRRSDMGRLREISRSRKVLCDALSGGNEYGSSLQDLEKYFFDFALAARVHKSA
jgi:hypothetical protein